MKTEPKTNKTKHKGKTKEAKETKKESNNF